MGEKKEREAIVQEVLEKLSEKLPDILDDYIPQYMEEHRAELALPRRAQVSLLRFHLREASLQAAEAARSELEQGQDLATLGPKYASHGTMREDAVIARDTGRAKRLLIDHLTTTTRILVEAKVVDLGQEQAVERRAAS